MLQPSAVSAPHPGRAALAAAVRRRWRGALVLLSYALFALAPLLSSSPFADLSWQYTDHLRHAHCSWIFLHAGLDIYREPFILAAAEVPYRSPLLTWPWVPYAYPPLVLLLFTPLALAMQYLPLSPPSVARLGILYTLLLAHLAFWVMLRALGRLGVVQGALAVFAWVMLMYAGLQGFYDPLWLACGVLMVRRLAQRRPSAALVWFSLAALLSYRAVVLVPLAFAALVVGVRGRPVRAWPWGAAGLALAAGLTCCVLFSFTLPFDWAFREAPALLERGGWRLALVLLVGAGAALIVARGADLAVATTVAGVTGFALMDTPQWWHALVLLPAPLAVGAWRAARWPRLSVGVLLLWAVVLQKSAWSSGQTGLPLEVARFLENAPRREPGWRPDSWYSASAWRWTPPGLRPPVPWYRATAWLWAAPALDSPLRADAPAVLLPSQGSPVPWLQQEVKALALRESSAARRTRPKRATTPPEREARPSSTQPR